MKREDPDGEQFVDLAGPLLPLLEANSHRAISEQIAAWQAYYDECCPELPERLYSHYENLEGKWRKVAEERIFPALKVRLPKMKLALEGIRALHHEVCRRAMDLFGLQERPIVVVYVGLGNGAGWATRWQGRLTVLLGLENIAELGWHQPDSLRALIAHEIGHLLMMQMRTDTEILAEDPLLALYEEGFAQHSEHLLAHSETWHCASQQGWLQWCLEHESHLAAKYLQSMNDREAWRRFFGSWYDVDGWRQTGYFLGCRLVQRMADEHALREIAGWPVGRISRETLAFLKAQSEQLPNGTSHPRPATSPAAPPPQTV